MPARHEPLLFAQHDVAVVRRIRREEGQQPAIGTLLVEPHRIALRDLRVAQRDGCRGSSLLNESADRYGQIDIGWIETAPCDGIDIA